MGKDWIASPTNKRKRICAKCRQPRTKQGHDPCIANLPGVMMACCGHGVRDGYIMFMDGRIIRGAFTVDMRWFNSKPENLFQEFHGLIKEIKNPYETVDGLAREFGIGELEKLLDYLEVFGGSRAGFHQTKTFIDAGRAYVLNHQQRQEELNDSQVR